jgi:hypothetical protein
MAADNGTWLPLLRSHFQLVFHSRTPKALLRQIVAGVLKDIVDGPAKVPKVKDFGRYWAMEDVLYAIDSEIEPEHQEELEGLLSLDNENRGVWFTPEQEYRYGKFIGKNVFVCLGYEALPEESDDAVNELTDEIMEEIDDLKKEVFGVAAVKEPEESAVGDKRPREKKDVTHTREELEQMTRKELQLVAKEYGVRGNQKNQIIISEILGEEISSPSPRKRRSRQIEKESDDEEEKEVFSEPESLGQHEGAARESKRTSEPGSLENNETEGEAREKNQEEEDSNIADKEQKNPEAEASETPAPDAVVAST